MKIEKLLEVVNNYIIKLEQELKYKDYEIKDLKERLKSEKQ